MPHSEPLFYSVLAFVVGFSTIYLVHEFMEWRQERGH